MWRKLKLLILKRLRLRESWVIFFILGIIMMNHPFISIFNKPYQTYHLPVLFIYLQIGWLVSIFVIYLYTKAIDLPEDEDDKGEHH